MLGLFLAACVTALATGLGALPVYAFGLDSQRAAAALWGIAAGAMLALVAVEIAPIAFTGENRLEGALAAVIAGVTTAALGILLSVS